ncbi:MAG: hypothetical protein J6Z43_03280 [Clostridiales bacterium]|nr:hypothetical protein [Clostridiales bacterium]
MLEYKRTTALLLSIAVITGSSACTAEPVQETEPGITYVTEIEASESVFALSDYVKDTYWLGSETGEFENTSYLSLVVNIDDSVFDSGETPSYYYSVSKDGEQVFMSDLVVMEEAVINCTFGTETGDLLPTDTYSVTCFDEDGAIIAGLSANVVETPIVAPQMNEDWTPYDDDEYLNSNTYSIDEEYAELVNTELTNWWDYSDTSVGLSAYASDSEVLGFSLVMNEWTEDDLYYAFYFTDDGNFSEEDENLDPIFVNRVGLSQYNDFASYDIDVKPGKVLPGYYYFVVSDDSEFSNIIMEGSCLVVEETMAELAEDD